MIRFIKRKRAVALFVVAAGTATAVALASAPSNFSGGPVVIANLQQDVHVNSERIKFQTKDPTDTGIFKLEFGANSKSGWHHHNGMVLVQVQQGTVRVYDSSCAYKTYGVDLPSGSVFVEGETVHQVTSEAGATAYATAVVEKHVPAAFRDEDAPPFCDNH